MNKPQSGLVRFDWPLVLHGKGEEQRWLFRVCGLGLAEMLLLAQRVPPRAARRFEECWRADDQLCCTSLNVVAVFTKYQPKLWSAVGAALLWLKFCSTQRGLVGLKNQRFAACGEISDILTAGRSSATNPSTYLSQEHHWWGRHVCSLAINILLKKASLTTSWPPHIHHPFVLPHGCLLVMRISHCEVGGTPVGLSCFQHACFVWQCCHGWSMGQTARTSSALISAGSLICCMAFDLITLCLSFPISEHGEQDTYLIGVYWGLALVGAVLWQYKAFYKH